MSRRGSNVSSSTELRSRLDRHFAACAGVIAGVAVAATPVSADAAVVTHNVNATGSVQPQFSSNAANGGVYIDFLDGTVASSASAFGSPSGSGALNWNVHLWSGTGSDSGYTYHFLVSEADKDQASTNKSALYDTALVSTPWYTGYGSFQAAKLTPGTTVGPNSSFNYKTASATFSNSNVSNSSGSGIFVDYTDGVDPDGSNWLPGESGYIGIEFLGYDSNLYYGWIHLTYNSDYTFTVDQFAYDNTPNTAITIPGGAVPEPATAAMLGGLGFGSLALRGRRRRLV